MEIIKLNGAKYKITVGSDAFAQGYTRGCDHPSFILGNTLDEAPPSDDLNPYENDSDEYWDWKIGFNTAIL